MVWQLPESPDRFPTGVFWQTGLVSGSVSQQIWHIEPQCPSCCLNLWVLLRAWESTGNVWSLELCMSAWHCGKNPNLWSMGMGRAPGSSRMHIFLFCAYFHLVSSTPIKEVLCIDIAPSDEGTWTRYSYSFSMVIFKWFCRNKHCFTVNTLVEINLTLKRKTVW